MKLTNAFVMCLTIALTLSSCKSNQYVATNTVGTVKTETLGQTENVVKNVVFGQWTVLNVGDQAVTGENRPYINFQKDASNPYLAKFYANDGCNMINGTFAITPGGKMEPTGEPAKTMMLCPDAPYEVGVTMAINTVRTYTIEKVGPEYLLYMKDGRGITTMTLRKSEIAYANGAWAITAINGNNLNPNRSVPEINIDIDSSRIHGNAGCNVFNGKVSTDPDVQNSIKFSEIVTTRMTCPDIDIEQAFLQTLANVTSVHQADNGDALIMKDASGKVVLHLVRIEQTED